MKPSNPQIPYDLESLYRLGSPRTYRGRALDNIAFPLGGIGTGSISLGGWGQLRDFEIFNRPAKGLLLNYTFFTLFAQQGDRPPVTRVVQGPVGGSDFTGRGSGVERLDGAGLPHFQSVAFMGGFPFARLDFADKAMPLNVSMEAFNPFIPLNEDDSGLPMALFSFDLKNPTTEPVRAILFANLENKTGHPDVGGGLIEYFEEANVRGLKMSTRKHAPDSPRYGTLALATPLEDLLVQTHWYRGPHFDSLHRFWDQASAGELHEDRTPVEIDEGTDVGTIGLRVTVEPGESLRLPVWIAWHTPNFEKYWHRGEPKPVWRNHYATRFVDAVAVAGYAAEHHDRLERDTRAFADALFASTLPESVLDAVSSQISILKSTTCLRLEDGTFYGWEGCHPDQGCCEGTCTHVWNYAQALPYLFPALERTVREADYAVNLHKDGHMTFRMPLPLGTVPEAAFHAAADGQMGGIMKVYREWQISGDDHWLRSMWPWVKRSLEYAWKYWDRDKDGVMEGVQHNTYDIEFYGPNTMMSSFYLGALKAAAAMARHLGAPKDAEKYEALMQRGREWVDRHLFNGEYYIQQVRPDAQKQTSHGGKKLEAGQLDPVATDQPKYQYGEGCISDQMIGQWYARMLGLGNFFDPEHVRSAMSAIFRHNWKPSLREHANPQRIYALNDEAGLLLATWPRGGRPALPFVYSDEVWCGIEYQVASHLIYEGFVEEGLAIVKGARDRHDGVRRNPWNEFECGNHYARSMSSYALLLALSGFSYSAPRQAIGFAPRINAEDFACFFSVDSGWGMLKQTLAPEARRARVEVHAGSLTLREISLGFDAAGPVVELRDKPVEATTHREDAVTLICLNEPVTIHAGEAITLDGPGRS